MPLLTSKRIDLAEAADKALGDAWEAIESLRLDEEEGARFASERGGKLKQLSGRIADARHDLVGLYS